MNDINQDPPFIFTEEFQAELMAMNFAAFDELRREGILHGEMIWNFADFMTKQQVNRVVGNRKGYLSVWWSQHLIELYKISQLIMWGHQNKPVHV